MSIMIITWPEELAGGDKKLRVYSMVGHIGRATIITSVWQPMVVISCRIEDNETPASARVFIRHTSLGFEGLKDLVV